VLKYYGPIKNLEMIKDPITGNYSVKLYYIILNNNKFRGNAMLNMKTKKQPQMPFTTQWV